MSAVFEAAMTAMNKIADEMNRIQRAEGMPELLLTGRIELDVSAERAWFEVLDDEHGITSWITADAPQLAAHGETLVATADLEDAMMMGRD